MSLDFISAGNIRVAQTSKIGSISKYTVTGAKHLLECFWRLVFHRFSWANFWGWIILVAELLRALLRMCPKINTCGRSWNRDDFCFETAVLELLDKCWKISNIFRWTLTLLNRADPSRNFSQGNLKRGKGKTLNYGSWKGQVRHFSWMVN